MRSVLKAGMLILLVQLFTACAVTQPSLQTVENVQLDRFMGDWYVIAFIPIFAEKDATNAIENYTLRPDGDVDITYTFFKESFDGKKKEYKARGFIPGEGNNSEWRVQFFWPLRFPYLIIDLAEDYSYTVIGVPNRKYLWIMARKPSIPDDIYDGILNSLRDRHYNIDNIRKVPQQWDTDEE